MVLYGSCNILTAIRDDTHTARALQNNQLAHLRLNCAHCYQITVPDVILH